MNAFHHIMALPDQIASDLGSDAPGLRPAARVLGTLAALVAVAVIGWLDALIPNDIALVLLYLGPIVACGWWLGSRTAGLVAVTAGLAFLVADVATRTPYSLSVSAWHGFTSLTVFLALGLATARVRVAQDRLAAVNRRLAVHLDQESTLARTDPHTGLPNMRAFLDHLRTEAARRRRDGQPLSVAYIDIDNFKQVNDIYGHGEGDVLLARIGAAIREGVRAGDVFARVGGDEFAVSFAETTRADVEAIAGRLAARIRAVATHYPLAAPDSSIGVAFFEQVPEDPETILHCADSAMYRAKQAGKGRIELSNEDAVQWVPEAVTDRIDLTLPGPESGAPASGRRGSDLVSLP